MIDSVDITKIGLHDRKAFLLDKFEILNVQNTV